MKAALLVIVAACSSGERGPKWRPAGNTEPRGGGTLHVAMQGQVRSLDPSIQYDEMSTTVVHTLFDTLVDYEPNGLRIIPRLAESWDRSADGLVYRFTLRPGLTFSDGTPLTSADCRYSLERALTTKDSPFGAFLADVAQGGITTPQPNVLEIRLAKPNTAFIYVMAMSFTTPQHADHVKAAGDQLRRRPLGSGPFVLGEWSEGERIVLRRNPNYWDKTRSRLDAIELLENIHRDTQFLMFERGELDMVNNLAAPDYLWVKAQPEWRPFVHERPGMNVFGARMNVRKKPYDDRRVRQALNYALNKRYTVKLLNGGAVASHGILPPGVFGRDDALAPYPHDPAKARALLAEAGYPNGFDAEFVVMNDEQAEKLAASMQSDLAAVGVRMRITVVSFSTLGTMIGDPNGPALSKNGWIGDFPDPTSFIDTKFHSRMISKEFSNNDSFYANPELDALLDAARVETDEPKRAALYRRAERILYDDAPWIWDYHQQLIEVTQPYVRDYVLHPVLARDYTPIWLDLGPNGERVAR